MKSKAPLPLLIALAIAGFMLLAIITPAREHAFPGLQLKLTQLAAGFGGLVAILSAVMMLLRAAAGQTLADLAPFTLPLLAGALFVGFHWGIALALGVIVVTTIVGRMVGTPAERRSRDAEMTGQPS
ncbi:MAG TPA: hypothetical protein DCY13_13240 [Verrucomicrobiales bacterium]|nr:hypothetical protein [Verrucomicrobiales bacterium]